MSFSPNGLLGQPVNATVTDYRDPVLTDGSFKLCTKPLFSRRPNPSDVRQGAIGDCYLLAALNSILVRHDGPEVIQGLMRDDGQGRVMFRFYINGAAKYVRVRKSYAHRTIGMGMHNLEAVWVSILEKAYAAVFRHGVYHDPKQNNSKGASCVGLAGGNSHAALLHLLGEGKAVSPPDLLGTLVHLSSAMAGGMKAIAESKQIVSDNIFQNDGADQANATRWTSWNVDKKKAALFEFYTGSPSSDKFVALLERIGQDLHPVTRALVIEWAHKSNLAPGAIGTGIYIPQQLEFFAKVARMIETQRAVAVSTKIKLVGPVTSRGHSAGEESSKGLYANHAYSVVECRVDSRSRRFLKLRNPHGEGFFSANMRTYKETPTHEFVPMAVRSAESWIELTDFYRNFELTMDVGPQIQSPARQKLMTNLPEQLQAQRNKLKDTAPPPPPENLGKVRS
jgi:hypothetical protein